MPAPTGKLLCHNYALSWLHLLNSSISIYLLFSFIVNFLLYIQDMTQQPPWQELVASDLHGNEWHFRHIFRGYKSNDFGFFCYLFFSWSLELFMKGVRKRGRVTH